MMPNYVGGRGKKAPYETTVIRVPKPLEHDVKKLISNYRNEPSDPLGIKLSVDEAIEYAKSILKSKKSARVSLEKLLQVLYNQPINL